MAAFIISFPSGLCGAGALRLQQDLSTGARMFCRRLRRGGIAALRSCRDNRGHTCSSCHSRVFSSAMWAHCAGGAAPQVARALHFCESGVDGKICGIALRRLGKINGALRKRNPTLGHADFLYDIECGVGHEHGVGVGESDVFACRNTKPAGYELGIFTTAIMRASQYTAASGSLPRMLLINADIMS